MKRIVALVLCAIMIFPIFVGCTPAQPTDTQPTEPQDNREWIEIEKNCYIIDEEKRIILGKTTFTLKGWVEAMEVSPVEGDIIQGGEVDGYMHIEAFSFPWDEYPDAEIKESKGRSFVYYTCDAVKTDPNDPDLKDIEASYMAVFARENLEWNVIRIIRDETYLAVCADTEREVWDDFDNFVKLYKQILLTPGAQ